MEKRIVKKFLICVLALSALVCLSGGLKVAEAAGTKLTDGTATYTPSNATSDAYYSWGTVLIYVSGNGTTLVIPCECPPGETGPACAVVFTWVPAKGRYKETSNSCGGGGGHILEFKPNGSVLEGIPEPDSPIVHAVGFGNYTQP